MRIRSALNRPGVVCLLLAVITLAVFWPVRRANFVSLDDPDYVTANPHVQQGLTRESVRWAFGAGYASNWHPLTWLSHMLDVELFGASPAGPHLVNLALHATNTVLLFFILRLFTGAHWRSAMVAVLFALHPLHVESVAWVAERKDVLSTLFGLLTLGAYGKYVSTAGGREAGKEALAPAPSKGLFYFVALVFFALGLLAKPMLVTLPFVLLLLDYWPLGRGGKAEARGPDGPAIFPRPSTLGGLVLEKLPFLFLAAVSCVLTIRAQRGAVQTWTEFSAGMRIENAIVACVRYLGKTFWPVNLAVPYPHPGHWPAPVVIGSAVLVAALSAVALWFGRRLPFVVTGWFWFLGTLVPVIGLVQVGIQSLADRYTYVPLIGIFIGVVWSARAVIRRWRIPAVAAVGLAIAVLGACAVRTRVQLSYWQNSESLFRHAIAVTRNNALAHYSLGYALAQKGDLDEAISHYQQALRIRSDSAEILENLGNALVNRGRYDEAIRCYESALRLEPNRASIPGGLGAAFFNTRRLDQAGEQFGLFLREFPGDAAAHFNLGNVFALQNRWQDAVAEYTQAVLWAPRSPKYHFALGAAFAQTGRRDAAITELKEALRLKPDNAEAKQLLESLAKDK
jgi:tetratricopeptide (TPR) repeat protein